MYKRKYVFILPLPPFSLFGVKLPRTSKVSLRREVFYSSQRWWRPWWHFLNSTTLLDFQKKGRNLYEFYVNFGCISINELLTSSWTLSLQDASDYLIFKVLKLLKVLQFWHSWFIPCLASRWRCLLCSPVAPLSNFEAGYGVWGVQQRLPLC